MKHVLKITVEFGDCDPSGIVFHPNFFSWFDAASLHFFRDSGIPPWRETLLTHGILGTPIVSTRCDFRAPARYGDQIEVHTCISEWRERRFTQHHQIPTIRSGFVPFRSRLRSAKCAIGSIRRSYRRQAERSRLARGGRVPTDRLEALFQATRRGGQPLWQTLPCRVRS